MQYIIVKNDFQNFNPIQDEPCRGCSRKEGEERAKEPPFPKICHTYMHILQSFNDETWRTVIPYLKKI